MADISAKFEKNLDGTSFSRELPERTELQNCHCVPQNSLQKLQAVLFQTLDAR